MKNNTKIKKNNILPIYILSILIFVFITTYLLYTVFVTNSNIKNNLIHESNNSISLYTEDNPADLYEIATYTTHIYDTDKNRIHNITLATKKLNGYVIKSGDEFSFNNALGEMDYKNGYKKSVGFDSNGNIIKMYGGGICQISSTLYNASLIANLTITERHAHSRRVDYVPKNKDATVYYGGPDLKFINNTSYDIIIYATTDGQNVTVTLMSNVEKTSKPLM